MAQGTKRSWACIVGLVFGISVIAGCGDDKGPVTSIPKSTSVGGAAVGSTGGLTGASLDGGASGSNATRADVVGGSPSSSAVGAGVGGGGGAAALTGGTASASVGGAATTSAGGTSAESSMSGGTSSEATGGTGTGQTRFESDDPTARTNNTSSSGTAGAAPSAAAGGSASTSAASNDPASGEEAQRAIVEADIVQVAGDKLYALSNYSGLSVIDVSAPEHLKLLGRYRVVADPFEMYVRDGIVYAMYSAFPRYEYDSATGSYKSFVSSRLLAIDARNPATMQSIGSFDLPGSVSDSRMVGDIVYVVSYENGTCWGCAASQPRTTVTSIAVADPASIAKVQQLAFDDQKSSIYVYKRSISVTTKRIYVSGMVYDGSWGSDTGHSTIQVVDISDPSGTLALGAQVPVTGQIENRWQMDEYDGVLRVLSQSGSTWRNGPAPTLETFRVVSAQSLTALGKMTLTLPQQENLKSVRFDGDRAYAVTFLQTDPLFTIDVSDPAAPKQMGEVLMPGYLYHMEPRGDRMIALGMDSGNATGGLTVSVFDVADLAHPSLLSRANFGGTWGWMPEDQDRIHKAFRIFDEVGLIVMPFSGWSYPTGGCGRYTSGIQLFDFTRDTVTARGVVPVKGQAKRALLHRSQLLAVSDDQVGSFNIANRDAPVRLDALALSTIAQKSVRVGERIVSLGLDWWTQTPQISVSPLSSNATTIPVITLDLAQKLEPAGGNCYGYWSSFYRSAELFVNGSLVYVVYDAGATGTASGSTEGSVGFAVIDVSDPAAPKLAGAQVLAIGQPKPNLGTSSSYYYYSYNYGFAVGPYSINRGIWPGGKRLVQLGSTIVLEELIPVDPASANYYQPSDSIAVLHAVDLSKPDNIVEFSKLSLSDTFSAGGLFSVGTTVFTSSYEAVPEHPSKVRFYVEQLDYSVPASPKRNRINVPGSLLTVARDGKRVVTVDYTSKVTTFTQPTGSYCNYQACSSTAALGTNFYQYGTVTTGAAGATSYVRTCPTACVVVDDSLKLVDLLATGAEVVDTYTPTGDRIYSIVNGDDRLWMQRYQSSSSSYVLDDLVGQSAGKLQMAARLALGSSYLVVAQGTKLSFVNYSVSNGTSVTYGLSELVVYDTVDPNEPNRLLKTELGVPYYSATDVALDKTHAVVSAGNYGAWAIAYQ